MIERPEGTFESEILFMDSEKKVHAFSKAIDFITSWLSFCTGTSLQLVLNFSQKMS
jgi:hypothetical protein